MGGVREDRDLAGICSCSMFDQLPGVFELEWGKELIYVVLLLLLGSPSSELCHHSFLYSFFLYTSSPASE